MAENSVPHVNFKGFMANNAQTNWIAIWKLYGSTNPTEPLEDGEYTYLFHWLVYLDKVFQKYIKPAMQFQYKQQCKAYHRRSRDEILYYPSMVVIF